MLWSGSTDAVSPRHGGAKKDLNAIRLAHLETDRETYLQVVWLLLCGVSWHFQLKEPLTGQDSP